MVNQNQDTSFAIQMLQIWSSETQYFEDYLADLQLEQKPLKYRHKLQLMNDFIRPVEVCWLLGACVPVSCKCAGV
jgi:hypothetical protein